MTKPFNDNSEVTAISTQIEILKQHFPQCFDKHGAFMSDKLQALVSEHGTAFSKESYSLNWLGKSYARLLANENPLTFLSEDKAHNQKPENKNTENLLIKGDNLEVLKHLKNAYHEQIKMIYIDPPYNTGTDGFVYQDDRKFTVDQLSRLAGIELDEAKRILDFTQSKANSHSAWLTFMYPRLYIARELLKEEGVIFISIDDNEAAQLKMLCDELFGEQNFITEFIWKRRSSSAMADNNVSTDHEYVITYQKGGLKGFQGIEKDFKNYSNPDNDPRGSWVLGDLTVGMTAAMRPNQAYDLVDPKTGKIYPFNPNRVWAFIPQSMTKMIEEGRIIFPDDTDKRPMQKRFKAELKGTYNPLSSLIIDKVGLNTEGTRQIQSLLGGNVFDYSKPASLLTTLIPQLCIESNDIIMDFFAGSGTTAHAVMDLNVESKNNYTFIMVQLPELIDKKTEAYKAGYKTIFDITKARIEKAAEKIKTEHPDYQGDLGFKIFEIVPMPEGYLVEHEILNSIDPLFFNGSNLNDDQLDDLLTTWKVYDGIALTVSLNPIDLAGYSAYQHQKILYLIQSGFSHHALVMLLQKLDDTDKDKAFDIERLVLFAHNFDSKHQREIKEALTHYQNKKSKNISVEFRY
ncbi:MAG: DNA methyltransferase [Methylococcales bacterium]